MIASPGLLDMKKVLLNNPTKETLVEIVNNAQFPNLLIKSMVFLAINQMKSEEVIRFSKVAVAAIQYIEKGDTEGLNNLCLKTGIPAPIISIINSYAANYTQQ